MSIPQRLSDILSGVERPGHFCHQGEAITPLPHLEVDGVGPVSFPLRLDQAKALLSRASPAPYGRGADTLLDPDVRRCHQLEPAQLIASLGPAWEQSVAVMAEQAAVGLGLGNEAVQAELYKVLLYQPGDFFLPHRDTEKADGMFGTLVVALPSPHTGGVLRVTHLGETEAIDLSGGPIWSVRYGAFYSDCRHELTPVTSGHRLCLIYNLTREGNAPLSAPDDRAAHAQLAGLLRDWSEAPDSPAKLVYLLEHRYTPAEFSARRLKNGDAAAADLLHRAAAAANCVAYLGTVSITETGSAEPLHYRRYGEYDEDDDFEVLDVIERTEEIGAWQGLDGAAVSLGPLPFDEDELSPPGSLEDELPDEQSFAEASGNASATYRRAYRRAALVVWHRSRFFDVLDAAPVESVIPYLHHLAEDGIDDAFLLAEHLLERMRTVKRSWSRRDRLSLTGAYLEAVLSLEDDELLTDALSLLPCPDFSLLDGPILCDAWKQRGWVAEQASAVALVAQHARGQFTACCALASLTARHGAPRDFTAALLTALLANAPGDPTLDPQLSWRASRPNKEAVRYLLSALSRCPAPLGDWLALITRTPTAWSVDEVLLPGLFLLVEHDPSALPSAAAQAVRGHCETFVMARVSQPLSQPADWTREAPFSPNGDPDQEALHAFLRSPTQPVLRLAINKSRRQTIHRLVEYQHIDATTTTLRQGSPYILQVTKNQASYDERVVQRGQDQKMLAILAEMAR